jgi:RNA-binding protein YhbY
MNWEDKSNNQILTEIKQMQMEHEAIKLRILREVESMEAVEKAFAEANKVMKERLSSNNG